MQDLAEQAARSQNSSDDVTNTTSLTSMTSLSAGLSVSAAASAVAAWAPTGAAGAGPQPAAAGSSAGVGSMLQQEVAGTPDGAAGSSRWALAQAARNLHEGFDAATTPFYTPVNRSRTGDE